MQAFNLVQKPRSIRVAGRAVNFPLALAPMVGLSHLGLRRIVRSYLPQGAFTLWPTEMLNSRRIPSEDLDALPEAYRDFSEEALVPQILGNEERFIAASLMKLEQWGAQGVDINMGCPVKKALQHNYGVALMGDAAYAREVVSMTVRNTSLPVSVKLRSGYSKNPKELIYFMQGLERAGASWLTLHPRTPDQLRRGRADWSQFSQVRNELSIPLVGNGDVQTAEDVISLREVHGCDLVMAGRALTARPWLFWQVGEMLGFAPPPGREGRAPKTPEEEGAEYGRMLNEALTQFSSLFQDRGESGLGRVASTQGESVPLWLRKFRFFVKTGSVWLDFGHQLFAGLQKCRSVEENRASLNEFFSRPQRMSARTELRQ